MQRSELKALWQKTLDILATELSSASFDAWLSSIEALSFVNNTIVLLAPNQFSRDWVESHYSEPIKRTLALLLNTAVDARFVLPQVESPSRKSEKYTPSTLNPKYTFNTFVVGNSNRFAHAASLAVAEAPAKAYNPLFLYGGVGLGKTHLMHAIGQYILNNSPSTRVLYVSSERFTNELINSIRDDKPEGFRGRYRNIDVLLIDDIQFLAGKERTQEEFFHTFNTLHEANKQVIISSDRPPKEIPTLEDRLRSRFEWGLITDIQAPDLETRIAILRKKADQENFPPNDDVVNYIATRIQSNIRELEGALLRVTASALFNHREITVDLAAEVLKDMANFNRTQTITITKIKEIVANHFSLQINDLVAKRRSRDVSFPRQIAMYLSRELTDSSLLTIGEEFGGRDHTTVIHACEKISSLRRDNPNFEQTFQSLAKTLSSF